MTAGPSDGNCEGKTLRAAHAAVPSPPWRESAVDMGLKVIEHAGGAHVQLKQQDPRRVVAEQGHDHDGWEARPTVRDGRGRDRMTQECVTDDDDEVITLEMRERADAVVARMRARWAAKDALTDQANRAFDIAFRNALRQPRSPKR